MNTQRLLYVFTGGPYSNASGPEGTDAAMVGAALEQEVSVLFLHDGVFQLKASQDTSNSKLKQFSKSYGALKDHDIAQVYVFDQSLRARGLATEDMTIDVEEINSDQVAELFRSQHQVLTF